MVLITSNFLHWSSWQKYFAGKKLSRFNNVLFVTKFVVIEILYKWLWKIPTQVDGRLDDAVIERNDEQVAEALVGAALPHEHDDAAGDERVDE